MASPLPNINNQIGAPYTGTHGAGSPNNWESRNAYDFAAKKGTPVYAVDAGVIGPQIGSLHSADPKMQGLRVHLVTAGNEFYYAHLSRLVVKAGEHVAAGQLLGYSGVANGVAHLHFAAKHGDPLTDLGDTPDQSAAPAGAPSPPSAAPPASAEAGAAETPATFTAPSPLRGGVTTAAALDPGMVGADGFSPRVYAETWQKIAADPWAPPEALNFAQMWQTATGG